jgi:hypothetical protein
MKALLGGILTPDLLTAVAGRPVRPPLSLVQGGRTGRGRDKRLLFLVEPGARHPFALVKWAQGAEAAGLVRETSALARIQAAGDPVLAASCPPSWGPFAIGPGVQVSIERYLPARGAYAQLRTSLWPRPLVAGHFRRAAGWLDRFARATRGPTRPFDQALLDEAIAVPLETCAARFDLPDGGVRATLDAARAHLGRPVALTAEHGDFWLANLLLPPAPDAAYVVDWEYFAPAALPGFDMLLFCMTYALEYPWRPFGWIDPATAVARAFVQPELLRPHIMGLLAQGCAAAGLPPPMLPVLLPAMLARMALRHAGGPAGSSPNNTWTVALAAWWARPAATWLVTWGETAGAP